MARTAFTRRQDYPQRDPYFNDAWTWPRYRYTESDNYPVDFTEKLESSETVSSVTVRDRFGVTIGTPVVASPVVTVPVTQGGEGSLALEVTTSAGRVFVEWMQWRQAYRNRTDAYRQGWRS